MKKHCTDTFRVHHITRVFSSLSEHNIKFYRGPSITFITLKVLKVNIAIAVIILCQVWGKVSLSCDVFVESKYKFS